MMDRNRVQRAMGELRKPAAKRTMGHDRDILGFLILFELVVSALDLEEDDPLRKQAEKLYNELQFPLTPDCLSCRFNNSQWSQEPCFRCLDEYEVDKPYPEWRRSPEYQ